ncbi:hypothetical protein V6N13_106184 [Hibiscus sabdariffa]
MKEEANLTVHSRVKDAKTSPINIAISICQVIHIQVNRSIGGTAARRLYFREHAKEQEQQQEQSTETNVLSWSTGGASGK